MKHEEEPKKEAPKKQESREQEYLDGWKRARADLENLQKRMGDMRIQEQQTLKRSVAESLIVLADNFKALTAHAPDSQDPWVAGVLHVARQFDQTLSDFGIETIETVGVAFDPTIHEAVEEVAGEGESGTVTEIVQVGYKIGDTTVRPAKVKVLA